LYHYPTSKEFGESNSTIKKKARDYIRNKLKDPPNEFWKQMRQELEKPFLQNMDYNFLFQERLALMGKLNYLADLLLSEPAAYMFPLHDIEVLIKTREKVYQNHLTIFIGLFEAKDERVLDFRIEWLILEQGKADNIIDKIKTDRLILSKKLAHNLIVRKYKNYLDEQLSTKDGKSNQDEYDNDSQKPHYLGYALLHHYWYKHSKKKSVQINQSSYRKWAKKYELDPTQLWKYARPMLEEEPKPAPHHISILHYGMEYKLILPLLKNICEPAFKEVEAHLKKLKQSNPNLNF
jgi:hypothetical protein